MIPLRADTRPVLETLRRENNPRTTWTIRPGESDLFFKCVYARLLDVFDAGGNHNVYVDVINDKGYKIPSDELKLYGFSLAYSMDGNKFNLVEFEKKEPEPSANFPLFAGNNASCMIRSSRQYTSDIVTNLVMPGREHKSYYVVFQLQKGGAITPPPPVVQPPNTISVNMNVILDIERKLAELTTAISNLR